MLKMLFSEMHILKIPGKAFTPPPPSRSAPANNVNATRIQYHLNDYINVIIWRHMNVGFQLKTHCFSNVV